MDYLVFFIVRKCVPCFYFGNRTYFPQRFFFPHRVSLSYAQSLATPNLRFVLKIRAVSYPALHFQLVASLQLAKKRSFFGVFHLRVTPLVGSKRVIDKKTKFFCQLIFVSLINFLMNTRLCVNFVSSVSSVFKKPYAGI